MRHLMLLMLLSLPAIAADVEFLPRNTIDADTGEVFDGLNFYFTNPADSQAEVTVTAIQHGKPVTQTEVIDTDREHGGHPDFSMLIDDGQRGDLLRMTITIHGWTYTWYHAKSGVRYDLTPPRRR